MITISTYSSNSFCCHFCYKRLILWFSNNLSCISFFFCCYTPQSVSLLKERKEVNWLHDCLHPTETISDASLSSGPVFGVHWTVVLFFKDMTFRSCSSDVDSLLWPVTCTVLSRTTRQHHPHQDMPSFWLVVL